MTAVTIQEFSQSWNLLNSIAGQKSLTLSFLSILKDGTSWILKSEIYRLFPDSKKSLFIYFETDENSIFDVLNPVGIKLLNRFQKGGSFTIHHYNIQTIAIGMFKACSKLSQNIFSDLFIRKEDIYIYHFGRNREFQIPRVNTVWNGSNSVRYFGPIIRDLINYKLSIIYKLIGKLQNGIHKWKPKKCPCRTVKLFVPKIGFCSISELSTTFSDVNLTFLKTWIEWCREISR